MPARLVVFLDYQNVYSLARECFEPVLAPPQAGQIDPLRLGELIATRSGDRELVEVRAYRGRPDSGRDPRGYGANVRQCAAWERHPKIKVVCRALRYPANWPLEKAQEKGIDVALAIDFVMMAVRGGYDVGLLMSTDTDLKPALEAVVGLEGDRYPRCEVASWTSPAGQSRRLSIPGRRVWCHWLSEDDYRSVSDSTDYGRR